MGLLEWECTVGLCLIKSSRKLIVSSYRIVSYPLRTHIENVRLSTCAMKQSSLLKQMAQCFYWGPTLLGAEFVRGRVCQGQSLSGAEMSQNHYEATGSPKMSSRTLMFSSDKTDKNFYCVKIWLNNAIL